MNIDKDIERCKELIKTEHSNWMGMSNQDAIENVLEEFERLEKLSFDVPLLTEDLNKARKANHELHDENIKLQMERDKLKEELEKYKKIAYKLAELINTHDIDEDVCKQMGKDFDCTLFNQDEKFCVQCIIDWAKREVKK